jgi:hypothetical protein
VGASACRLSLVEACEDFERQLPDHSRSQARLIDHYLSSLREADRLQREFEQAAGDFIDPHGLMHEVINQARGATAGWQRRCKACSPSTSSRAGRLRAAGRTWTCSTSWWPTDSRRAGRRVAYLMVDALRYELGVALERMLAEDGPVENCRRPTRSCQRSRRWAWPACLPGACSGLTLQLDGDALVPSLAGAP